MELPTHCEKCSILGSVHKNLLGSASHCVPTEHIVMAHTLMFPQTYFSWLAHYFSPSPAVLGVS